MPLDPSWNGQVDKRRATREREITFNLNTKSSERRNAELSQCQRCWPASIERNNKLMNDINI